MSKFNYDEIKKELRAVDEGARSVRTILAERLGKLRAQGKDSGEGVSIAAEEALIRDLLDRLEASAQEKKEAIRRRKEIRIMTEETPGRIDLFFDAPLYMCTEEDLEEMNHIALDTCLEGESNGWDLSKAEYGHLCCYFNPVRENGYAEARVGCDRMIDFILSCHPSVFRSRG